MNQTLQWMAIVGATGLAIYAINQSKKDVLLDLDVKDFGSSFSDSLEDVWKRTGFALDFE